MSCPKAYQLTYLSEEHHSGSGNAFSDYGLFTHSLLDRWAKGELEPWQLPIEWEAGYEAAITHYFPPFMKNYDEKARQLGRDYFASFDGFPGYDIVASEHRFTTLIGPYPFDGIVDLVLRDQKDGSLLVIDHKTKGLSSMQREFDLFRNQLYIYAAHVKEQYGEWPSKLAFNMIKTGNLLVEEFSEEQMQKTIDWAVSTIDKICMDFEFAPNVENFHCRQICDVRSQCDEYPMVY